MTTVSGIPFWETSPEVFGVVTLGKHTLTGIKDVSIKRGRKRDKKSAPGTNGAKLGNKGFEAGTVKIEWHVCTVEGDEPAQRWDAAAVILADLEDKKRTEEALAIAHPFCQIRGISSVTLDDIEGPDVVESSGLFAFTFTCTEYTTPAAAKSGGKGGKGAGGGEGFDATYMFPGGDATKPLFGKITEQVAGTYREAKSGKKVVLLDIPPTADNPKKLTPRELAFDKALTAAAGTGGTGTFKQVDDDVVGDIAFVESDDGTKSISEEAKRYLQTEAKDLDP